MSLSERRRPSSPNDGQPLSQSINDDDSPRHYEYDRDFCESDDNTCPSRFSGSYLDDEGDTMLPEVLTEKSPLLPPTADGPFWKDSRTGSVLSNISQLFSGSVRHLQKSLGFAQGFFLIVGILMGSGIFLSPSLVARSTDNMSMALVIWVACGVIALLGALCFCELGCALQKAGGNYAYILEAYGGMPAFLSSWTTVLIIDPAGIAVVTLTFGTYAVKPFTDDESEVVWLSKALAALCILIVAAVNCLSVTGAARAQAIFTMAQIFAVCFVIVLGVWQMAVGKTENIEAMFGGKNTTTPSHFGLAGVAHLSTALYNGLWSYDGWALVSNVTEEMHNLERNLLLSIITGIPFVIFCYVAVNLSFMSVLSRDEIASSPTTVINFVEKILGRKVAYVMPFLVALSCFGAVNGAVFSCGRLTLAAAREGHMPAAFGMIHKRRFTPIPAILLASLISILMLLPGGSNLESLIGYFNFACWTIYGVSIFAVIVLRVKKPDLHRPFKIWIAVPVLMSLVSLFLVLLPFFNNPLESGITMLVILSGVPVYLLLVYSADKHCQCFRRFRKATNRAIQKAFNLAPCRF